MLQGLGRVAQIWQTRRLQVPVFERMWGFKSPLAHQKSAVVLLPAPSPPRELLGVSDDREHRHEPLVDDHEEKQAEKVSANS